MAGTRSPTPAGIHGLGPAVRDLGPLSAMMTATKTVGDALAHAMAMLGRAAAIAVLVAALGGGAKDQLVDCRGGQKPAQVAELMFGRNIGTRTAVNESQ